MALSAAGKRVAVAAPDLGAFVDALSLVSSARVAPAVRDFLESAVVDGSEKSRSLLFAANGSLEDENVFACLERSRFLPEIEDGAQRAMRGFGRLAVSYYASQVTDTIFTDNFKGFDAKKPPAWFDENAQWLRVLAVLAAQNLRPSEVPSNAALGCRAGVPDDD